MDINYSIESDLDSSFAQLLLDSDAEDDYGIDDPQLDDVVLNRRSGSDSGSSIDSDTNEGWVSDAEARNRWGFTETFGPSPRVLTRSTPMEYYAFFLTQSVLNLIVTETNRYGKQKDVDFVNTNAEEVKKFLGLCIQMGLVKLPSLRDYWSNRSALGGRSIGGGVMSRYRFETLMKCLHFCDNANPDGDRLFKIKEFRELFNTACETMHGPAREIVIDESLVPFRERAIFRQYLPSKKHKYGIKLFKLCTQGGYTWRTKIYAGKEATRNGPVADSVVFSLIDGLLDQGRRLYCDNWYSSLGLAKNLIRRRTDLTGTLRKNCRCIPVQVKQRKLKRGDIYYQQNKDKILILKWKDKRDLYMISTRHDGIFGEYFKPLVVEDYNKWMGFVDQSDQMAAYSPFVCRTTKWYLRIFFHLMTQTGIVNAWRLFCTTREKIRLNDFKMQIIESLLEGNSGRSPSPQINHELEEIRGGTRGEVCKRCLGRCKEHCQEKGRIDAMSHARRITIRCSNCLQHYCIKVLSKIS